MINQIKQHIPSFVDGVKSKITNFKSTKELLEIEWVRSWTKLEGFKYFSISKNYYKKVALLMVHSAEHYYVAGYIKNGSQINLPEWKDE